MTVSEHSTVFGSNNQQMAENFLLQLYFHSLKPQTTEL